MASIELKFSDNVQGRFFVDIDCIYCGLCSEVAPNNFAASQTLDHDIVYKQPENEIEINACIDAMESCPVCAIGDSETELFLEKVI